MKKLLLLLATVFLLSSNFCLAADFASAVMQADPSFQVAAVEVRGEEVVVASAGGGAWW